MSEKTNLLNYSRTQLRQLLAEWGEKPYRADQLIKWLHQQVASDFSQMSNLSGAFRLLLAEKALIEPPMISSDRLSSDGTRKWLLRLADNNHIEMVYIPEKQRGTLCISSQVGCALNCDFCSTAKQGFSRNLTVAEIIGQLYLAKRELVKTGQRMTNVVLMGMGEPLLNLDAVIPALELMLDDYAYGLSKYRVTLSTSGVLPGLDRLKAVSDVALAVSLHAPNDALRNRLVPLNKKYPISQLLDSCKRYFSKESKRSVTFEYVMLAGINDSVSLAQELVQRLQGIRCKVNLIPFNPFPNSGYCCSTPEAIARFAQVLQSAGFNVIVRRTRGDDIIAACGQLVGQFIDKTQRHARWLGKPSIPIHVEEVAK